MWEACFEKPIGTSVPEKLEKRGTHDVSYQGGGGGGLWKDGGVRNI